MNAPWDSFHLEASWLSKRASFHICHMLSAAFVSSLLKPARSVSQSKKLARVQKRAYFPKKRVVIGTCSPQSQFAFCKAS